MQGLGEMDGNGRLSAGPARLQSEEFLAALQLPDATFLAILYGRIWCLEQHRHGDLMMRKSATCRYMNQVRRQKEYQEARAHELDGFRANGEDPCNGLCGIGEDDIPEGLCLQGCRIGSSGGEQGFQISPRVSGSGPKPWLLT